jgi:hypothetical protein
VPTLVIAGAVLAVIGPNTFSGQTIGVSNILWVVGIAFTLSLTPFLLFVAKRTLAIGPLVVRDSQY